MSDGWMRDVVAGPGDDDPAYPAAALGTGARNEPHPSGDRGPLNRTSALCSSSGHWLSRFRGVSTRRLANYLAWPTWALDARRTPLRAGAARGGGAVPRVPHHEEGLRGDALPLPPGARRVGGRVQGGLTQPYQKGGRPMALVSWYVYALFPYQFHPELDAFTSMVGYHRH